MIFALRQANGRYFVGNSTAYCFNGDAIYYPPDALGTPIAYFPFDYDFTDRTGACLPCVLRFCASLCAATLDMRFFASISACAA